MEEKTRNVKDQDQDPKHSVTLPFSGTFFSIEHHKNEFQPLSAREKRVVGKSKGFLNISFKQKVFLQNGILR